MSLPIVAANSTVTRSFNTTRFSSGAPFLLDGTPSLHARVAGAAGEITTGFTLTANFDSKTGENQWVLDLSTSASYTAGSVVEVFIAAGTVDSVSVVGLKVYEFQIGTSGSLDAAITRTLLALPSVAPNANGGLPILSSSGTTLGYTVATVTTLTGHTPQTGDSFARIGATGSGLTTLAPSATALSTAQWTNARAGYLDNINNANLANVPTFPTNFATLSITAGGTIATVDSVTTVQGIAGNAITSTVLAASAITEIQAGLATPTNITAGTITTVTNLTNAPTAGDFTAVMKTSITAAVPTAAQIDTQLSGTHGAGAWGGSAGSGAYTITLTVNDGATALENATIRLTEGVNTFTGTTNASGIAAFSLDAATYSVAITKDGYSFTPTTLVVTATAPQTYSMTAVTITPSDPAQTTGYVTIYTGAHVVVAGAVVEIQILKLANGTTGSGINDPLISGTTNGSGYVEFVGLPRGATYQVRVDGGPWFKGTTASAATTPLAGVLGVAE